MIGDYGFLGYEKGTWKTIYIILNVDVVKQRKYVRNKLITYPMDFCCTTLKVTTAL